METEELIIGNKYVPLKKTIMGSLRYSNVWKDAKKIKQKYLYYTGKDDSYYVFSFTPDKNNGDYFNPSDVIPYIENEDFIFNF